MKNILIILIISFAIFAFSGFKSNDIELEWGSKPEDTIESFFEAINTYDFEKIKALTFEENIDKIDNLTSGENKYISNLEEVLKINAEKISYEILESNVEGDKASYKVKCTYIDASRQFGEATGYIINQVIESSLSGVKLNEEELNKLLAIVFKTKLPEMEEQIIEKPINISCIRIDKKWYIEDITDEIADVMLSNIYSLK